MQFSIVKFQEIKNVGFRTDAEYWHPEFIKNADLVSTKTKIKDVITPNIPNIKSFPINRDFDYLEISNISTNSCEYQTVPVKQGEEPDRAHYILKKKDIAVSTVRPNRNAVAFVEEDGIIGSSGLSVLRVKNIEPEYLFAFCKTDYFVKCLVRANRASMYPAVANNDILDTPLLVPSKGFRKMIAEVIQDSIFCAHVAVQSYVESQNFLMSELGIVNWQSPHILTFLVKFSDTRRADRMDSDYFQPKYDEIIAAIKGCAGGWDMLGNLVTINKCIEVGSAEYLDAGIPFVRVSNLNPFDLTEEKYISEDLYTEIQHHQPEQGEILLSKDATPGIAHYLRDEPQAMIPSSGILILKSKTARVNNEYLTLVLNSLLTQEQVNRDVGGSVILHWRPEQVRETLIPILPKETQSEIQEAVTESFNLRQQSKTLLHRAKRAVEIAIEQGEQTAIEWLESEDS